MRLVISAIAGVFDPDLTQALRLTKRAAKCGSVEVVIDRICQLGRHPTDVVARISSLRHKGVRMLFRSEDITELPIDQSVPMLLTVLSTLERQQTARRTSRAVQNAKLRGSSSGRTLVMTPERQAIAVRMLSQGKRGRQILQVIQGLGGPNISQSAYYLWQNAWLESSNTIQRDTNSSV